MSTTAPPSETTTPAAAPPPESVPVTTAAAPKPVAPTVPALHKALVPAAHPKPPPTAVVRLPPVAAPAPTARVTSANSSKSSRKKKAPSVTMATAPNQSSSGAHGENTGRWTAEEHRLFLQGLEQHGKGWKKIASLIKSRTVVQIRTHAQKYFQKLAKARQNGEDACDVTMEGRTSVGSVGGTTNNVAAQCNKRRRQITGTKRKAIQSVVSSAIRQGKKMAAAQAAAGVPDPVPPLPAVAPALAHFVLPQTASGVSSTTTITTTQGNISGAALEESLFRFLTPVPVAPSDSQVNDVARQAGANPITLPSSKPSSAPSIGGGGGGEISPTGVNDVSIYPSWTDAKDPPSWYAKGGDVDALLDVADTLDWLADTGDPNETFQGVPPPPMDEDPMAPDMHLSAGAADDDDDDDGDNVGGFHDAKADLGSGINSTSVSTLPHVDSNVESVVPPLPALFEGASERVEAEEEVEEEDNAAKALTTIKSDNTLSLHQHPSEPNMHDHQHLEVFDSPMDEHEFVSTILQQQDNKSSSDNLAWNIKVDEEHVDDTS